MTHSISLELVNSGNASKCCRQDLGMKFLLVLKHLSATTEVQGRKGEVTCHLSPAKPVICFQLTAQADREGWGSVRQRASVRVESLVLRLHLLTLLRNGLFESMASIHIYLGCGESFGAGGHSRWLSRRPGRIMERA